MKFIVDAQLPKKLSRYLNEIGFDAVHTLELAKGNKTKDTEIVRISIEEKRILISKDADFYNIYLQKAEPYKLIYLTVGNISTLKLIQIFSKNWDRILEEVQLNYVIEISPNSIITIF